MREINGGIVVLRKRAMYCKIFQSIERKSNSKYRMLYLASNTRCLFISPLVLVEILKSLSKIVDFRLNQKMTPILMFYIKGI